MQLEQRISSRIPCSFSLQLKTAKGADARTVEALNISFMGLGFRHGLGQDQLAPGQDVQLGLSGHNAVDATIRWSNSQCAGVQFSECLDHVWESWVVTALPGSKAGTFSVN